MFYIIPLQQQNNDLMYVYAPDSEWAFAKTNWWSLRKYIWNMCPFNLTTWIIAPLYGRVASNLAYLIVRMKQVSGTPLTIMINYNAVSSSYANVSHWDRDFNLVLKILSKNDSPIFFLLFLIFSQVNDDSKAVEN